MKENSTRNSARLELSTHSYPCFDSNKRCIKNTIYHKYPHPWILNYCSYISWLTVFVRNGRPWIGFEPTTSWSPDHRCTQVKNPGGGSMRFGFERGPVFLGILHFFLTSFWKISVLLNHTLPSDFFLTRS